MEKFVEIDLGNPPAGYALTSAEKEKRFKYCIVNSPRQKMGNISFRGSKV